MLLKCGGQKRGQAAEVWWTGERTGCRKLEAEQAGVAVRGYLGWRKL